MRNRREKVALLALCAMLLALAAGCGQLGKNLDVVGKESVASFESVLNVTADTVTADEANVGWSLAAPDGTVRFIWSADYSQSPRYDVILELDARPFIDAGLDAAKLPESMVFYEDKLLVGTKLGNDTLNYDGDPTPLVPYQQIVNLYRDAIGYHTALDHYGVSLGDGNMFEWAKDMGKNDKDIVFVLNPDPLIAAGVDPNGVDGWIFAKVSVEIDGKPAQVDKLLKPFDLQ